MKQVNSSGIIGQLVPRVSTIVLTCFMVGGLFFVDLSSLVPEDKGGAQQPSTAFSFLTGGSETSGNPDAKPTSSTPTTHSKEATATSGSSKAKESEPSPTASSDRGSVGDAGARTDTGTVQPSRAPSGAGGNYVPQPPIPPRYEAPNTPAPTPTRTTSPSVQQPSVTQTAPGARDTAKPTVGGNGGVRGDSPNSPNSVTRGSILHMQ